MFIDYIGQELIWQITGTHPYEQNATSCVIYLKCKSAKENEDATNFLIEHLKDYDTGIIFEPNKWDNNGTFVTESVKLINVFGKESKVMFFNDFKAINNFNYTVPCGQILKDYMKDEHISIRKLAKLTGQSQYYIKNVINNKQEMTENFAKGLTNVFSMPYTFWLNLQDIKNA